MTTANEKLQSQAISHQVDLQHYSNGEVRKIIALLNRVDADLVSRIESALQRLDGSTFTVRHMAAMLSSVRELNREIFAQLGETLQGDLADLAQFELDHQAASFAAAIPGEVLAVHPLAAVSMEQVRNIAFSRPFQGRLLSEWLDGLEQSRTVQIRDAIRIGMVEGQTTSQIVQRIRGTRAEGYADGLLQRTRRDVETIVRTAVSHVAGVGRDAFYGANTDLIKAERWLSTLDGRTTPACRIRDNLQYTPVEHKPIGHKVPWLSGPGRLHMCCRSMSTPVTKSWQELGLDFDEISPSTRASMNGQVPADMSYASWLKGQSPDRQDQILGKAKGAMFRTGKLPMDRFYNDKGKMLTLEQLKVQEAAAYAKAGLSNPIKPPQGSRKDEIAIFLASRDAQVGLLSSLYAQEGISLANSIKHVTAAKSEHAYKASVESLAAVRWYTGSGYAAMNKRLREQHGLLKDRQYQALTVQGVEGMRPFDGPVYRAPTRRIEMADGWWGRAVIGDALDMGAQFQSFSASREFASAWGDKADLLLRIARPRKGAYIEPVTFHEEEHEVLFPPGLKYRVTDKAFEDVDGKRYRVIDLEIIDE